MDRYEYKLKLDRMKSLVADQDYEAAAQIADSINWHKIKNVNALMKVGEIYEKVGRYEESKDVFLMAYDRSPIGRMIIFRLAQVAIKMENYDDANDYYEEFVTIAPHDTLKYVLKYQIAKAKGENIPDQIAILEELKEQEYSEEWSYELAYLYYRAGESEKCVETCDELILWFGDGPYVEKALELKMKYQPLTKEQEEKYRQFCQKKEGMIEVRPEDYLESGEVIHEPVQIPKVKLSPERFNTQNLQAEIQRNIVEIMQEKEPDTIDDSMDNIKKPVENVSGLQASGQEVLEQEIPSASHITAEKPTGDTQKINFKESLRRQNVSEFMPVSGRQINPSAKAAQDGIDNMLLEWEKTRREAEEVLIEKDRQELESTKARVLQEAGDIMERLVDVIPGLDAGLMPQELIREPYVGEQAIPEDRAAAMVANMNQILQKQIDKLENENAKMDRQIAAAGGNTGRPAVSDRIPGYRQGIPGTVMPEGFHIEERKPQATILKNEKLQEIWPVIKRPDNTVLENVAVQKDVLKEESLQEQIKAVFDKSKSLEDFKNQILQANAEVSEETNVQDVHSQMFESEERTAVHHTQDAVQTKEIQTQEIVKQEVPQQELLGEEIQQEISVQATGVRELLPENGLPEISLPEDLEDLEEQKKPEVTLTVLPEIKPVMPTAIDLEKAIQKETERGIPVEEFSKAVISEAEQQEDTPITPVYTKLSDEQREIFSYFVFIKGMEGQICQAMTSAVKHLMLRKNASIGNMVIQGGEGSGKTVLAGSMLKAIQKETGKPGGSIGKIEAAVLNKKDLKALLRKVSGGCLIIEKAGGISKETAVQIGQLLAVDESGLFVILEDTYNGIEKALSQDAGFASRFSEKVSIPIFTSDDLVTFAKSYANEMGYTIDEMGILALYNSISNIQKLDRATTLTEVKEIVDEAIVKVEQGGLKKVFSIIASTRYDQEDYVILHEKDFVF